MINGLENHKVFVSTVVEQDQRLSNSILWRLQSAFYQQSGITAWNRGFVPHYITNNPYIAGAYARVVQGYLRDHPPRNPTQPVYILELGAGSGRFAYHFLNRMVDRFLPVMGGGPRFVYLLSDLAESNVSFWRQHPRLQSYLKDGSLDLACFDPMHDSQIQLVCSGRTLSKGDFANPPVVLANYFFDSLPNDLFSIRSGILCEERVTLTGGDPRLTPYDPAIVPSLEIKFRPRFTTPQYYLDPDFDRLLQAYLPALEGACFQFPIGALESLRNLLRLADGPMLLLTADKGEYQLEELRRSTEPEISLHGSGFSMMVNVHALASYICQQGGQALQVKHREEGLVMAAFLTGPGAENSLETRRAFREAIEEASPDDFFMLKKAFEAHYASATLEQLLAFLRLSGYDPQIFGGMASVLLAQAETVDLRQQTLLYEAACRVWKMFYPIGEPQDLQLALAKVFIAVGGYLDALDCLRSSQQFYGLTEETDGLIALCKRYVWEEEGG